MRPGQQFETTYGSRGRRLLTLMAVTTGLHGLLGMQMDISKVTYISTD